MDLASLIPLTQQAFDGLITRPKLSEKHLKRPPFRFLHDIVTNTLATGFAPGLLTEEESDSKQVNTKAGKIAFLEKVARFVGICTGEELDFRASKVVAGMEAEQTNALLQAFARCARDTSLDQAEAVRLALAGADPGSVPPPRSGPGGAEAKLSADEAAPPPADAKGGFDGGPGGGPSDDKGADPSDAKLASGSPAGLEAPDAKGRGASRRGSRLGPPVGGMGPSGDKAAPSSRLDAEIDACDGSMERTRALLEPILQGKPKLSDRLLSKPPFRFLFDVISAVAAATGFGADLYGEEDANPKAFDKAQKIHYLERILRLVGAQLNTIVDARPAKIVAGQEPENTNVFLQLLGVAATHAPGAPDALEPAGAADARAPAKDGPPAPAPSPRAEAQPERAQEKAQEKDEEDGGGGDPPLPEAKAAPAAVLAAVRGAKAQELLEEKEERKRSMRPTTARRRPPKVKTNVMEVAKKEEVAAAPAVGILGDGDAALDDDDDEDEEEEEEGAALGAQAKGLGGGGGHHSKLVKDIMKQQEDDRAQRDGAEGGEAEAEAKKAGGIRLGRLKKTGAEKKGVGFSDNELAHLRASLQALCASIMPLGKCMDFVTEDMASMDRELDKWRQEASVHKDRLEQVRQRTEEEVEPLRLRLVDLDEQVESRIRGINALKAKVMQNEDRINSLLRMVSQVN